MFWNGISSSRIVALLMMGVFVGSCDNAPSSNVDVTTGPQPPTDPNAIVDITFHFETHRRFAPGSDNWALTWADDGHQYTNWGDGGGFGGTDDIGRVATGVGRIEGGFGELVGTNLDGGVDPASGDATFPSEGKWGGKSRSMLALGINLYMWMSPRSSTDLCEGLRCGFERMQLWKSPDRGQTWTMDGMPTWRHSDGETISLFHAVNMGQDHGSAIDSYLYITALEIQDAEQEWWPSVQEPGELVLLRVPAVPDAIEDKAAYQYFAGLDESGAPTWSYDIADRQPVLIEPDGLHTPSLTYIPPLDRFILFAPHTETDAGNLVMYEAERPWGPYTLVRRWTEWTIPGESLNWYFWDISPKWISPDGREIVIMATGTGDNDSLNLVRASLHTEGG